MISRGNFKGTGRGSGFSGGELVELFLHIEPVISITSNDWEQVSSLFPGFFLVELMMQCVGNLMHWYV